MFPGAKATEEPRRTDNDAFIRLELDALVKPWYLSVVADMSLQGCGCSENGAEKLQEQATLTLLDLPR